MKKTTFSIFILALAIIGCKGKNTTTKKNVEAVSKIGINLALMDTLASPKEDFFNYVNGTWIKNNEIPADRTRWGSFNELRKNTDADVLRILEREMNNENLDEQSSSGKAVLLYKSILNMDARNKAGITPIKPYLEKINAITNVVDLQEYLTEMASVGGAGFFGSHIRADSKDSNKNVVYLSAGSLGLPDKDYYVKDDEDSKEKRGKYVAHIAKMLQFLGDSKEEATKQATQILAFETTMAIPRLDKVERRDARKRYNPMAITDLQKMVPAINWNTYFKKLGMKADTIIVSQLKYTKALQNILSEDNLNNWKTYMRWTVFNKAGGALSDEIQKESWNFYSKTLHGAKEQRPQTERALAIVNRTLGEALGKLYITENFPPEAKQKAKNMIANVLDAFEIRIKNVSWMSEETKLKAIEKLKATTIKIGYPDKWKDYSELVIGESYFKNRLNATKWRFNKNIEKLNKPVDKTEWHMSPQTVNAYFNPSNNEIVFPAAILQPPFYDYKADNAVNYGGIGAVIGHEISHSFDDSGARYDKDGNLNDWWEKEDLIQFEALGKKLANQYNAIEVLPKIFINGALTLGENIGDLGGVNVAYDALQLEFAKNGKPENIDGFTPEQRYFMSWATIWRSKYRKEALKSQIKTGPHSPGMIRAIQPLKNIDAFYKAFNIEKGDKEYLSPENRIKIW